MTARYERQIRLPEIGLSGQARLGAARVTLAASGFARSIERRYLELAGVGDVSDGVNVAPAEGEETLTACAIEDPACREVARGALHALRALRDVVAPSSAAAPAERT